MSASRDSGGGSGGLGDPAPLATGVDLRALSLGTDGSVALPRGWSVTHRPAPGVVLVGAEVAHPVFLANVVVTLSDLAGMSLADWQETTDRALQRALASYRVLDLEHWGAHGGRRLAHHSSAEGAALTMEQWFTCVGGVGRTLTATVDTARHDAVTDIFAAIAKSWRPPADRPS